MTWGIPFALYVERRTAMLNQVAHLVLVANVDLRLPPTWWLILHPIIPIENSSRWCMMTSFHGNIFRLTGSLWRESTGDCWPSQRASNAGPDVFFDLRLNKRLHKQSGAGDLKHHVGHYDVTVMSSNFVIFHIDYPFTSYTLIMTFYHPLNNIILKISPLVKRC